MGKAAKTILVFISSLALVALSAVGGLLYWHYQDQPQLYSEPRYETGFPAFDVEDGKFSILLFSKTNGYRHKEAIEAGNYFFEQLANANNWQVISTENGALFNDKLLRRFDVIVWNNVSGAVLTSEQRRSFERYLKAGGGFLAIHAAGDDSHSDWAWYESSVIGASFVGHTFIPHTPVATVRLNAAHPISTGLPHSLQHEEEWYSFRQNPKGADLTVIASVDEQDYIPNLLFGSQQLSMGEKHPVMWAHDLQSGRAVYTAFGHEAKTYNLEWFQQLLEKSLRWAGRIGKN
jgi:type 1 glutamine amidotransferase